jgi:hypothetical protein
MISGCSPKVRRTAQEFAWRSQRDSTLQITRHPTGKPWPNLSQRIDITGHRESLGEIKYRHDFTTWWVHNIFWVLLKILCAVHLKHCGKEWVWPEFVEDFIQCVTSYNWPPTIVTVRLLYPTVLHHDFIVCHNIKMFSPFQHI